MVENDKKAWMGVGVSNTYTKILQNLYKTINDINYSEILIIIADEPNVKYNNNPKEQLAEDFFNLAKKSKHKFKDTKIEVKKWKHFSKNKTYQKILERYKEKFEKHKKFNKDVLSLVRKNRQFYSDGKEEKMANYVLEELSSIDFMNKKGYIKIGPKNKEKEFDELAKKHSDEKELEFERF